MILNHWFILIFFFLSLCSVYCLKTIGLMTSAKMQLSYWAGSQEKSTENANRIAQLLPFLLIQFHHTDLMGVLNSSMLFICTLDSKWKAAEFSSKSLFIVNGSNLSLLVSFFSFNQSLLRIILVYDTRNFVDQYQSLQVRNSFIWKQVCNYMQFDYKI